MKKRSVCVVLAVCFVAILAFGTNASAKDKITLRFATFTPPQGVNSTVMKEWAEEVKRQSDGRIQVRFYFSQSLVKIPEMLDAVAAGTTDMAFLNTVPFPDRLPLTQVMGMPTILYHKSEDASQAWWALYEKYPELRKEYTDAGMKALWVGMPGPNQIEGRVAIKKLEDLKGLKAGVETREESKAFELFGAASVTLQGADFYTAMERGVIQTSTQNFLGSMTWKTHQIAPCFTANVDLNYRVVPIVINLKSYDRIPDDLKPIFDKVTNGHHWSKCNGRAIDESNANCEKFITEYHKKHGNPGVYYLPEAEKARLRELVIPINLGWVEEMEAKGLPGKAIFEDLQKMAETKKFQ